MRCWRGTRYGPPTRASSVPRYWFRKSSRVRSHSSASTGGFHWRRSGKVFEWHRDHEVRTGAHGKRGSSAEARDAGAFLAFDEAGPPLSDRCFAQRRREVGRMNEMPTWMESHPAYSGPLACTTHFGAHLYPATPRRFVFKATLDYRSTGCATKA